MQDTPINIKTVDWMQHGDFMLISNGVDAVAKLDMTDKEAILEVKKPSFGIYHKGKIFSDKDIENFRPE